MLGISAILPTFAQDEATTEAVAEPVATATATPAAESTSAADAVATSQANTLPAPTATPAQEPLEIPDPVATVNGEAISKAELEESFNNAVSGAGVDPSALSNEQKLAGYNQILQDMITDKLVKEASKDIEVTDADVDAEIAKIKEQFPTPEAFEQQLEQSGQTEEKLRGLIKDGLGQRKWVESQVGDTEVTDEEAKAFYEENSEQFEQPEMVRASHILILTPDDADEGTMKEKEEAANEAAEEVRADGADFNEVAKKLSEEPGADESGGDLDFFTKEQMVPEFADAAFGMEVGEISDPVKTQFGYHVIKVTDKKEAGKMPFEEVKPQLEAFLKGQKDQAGVNEVLAKLRGDAEIDVELPQPTGMGMGMGMGAPGAGAAPTAADADADATPEASPESAEN